MGNGSVIKEYDLRNGKWSSGVPLSSIAVTGDPNFAMFLQTLLDFYQVLVIQQALYTSTTTMDAGNVRFLTAANTLKVNFL